jgi:hypothetical protein
MRLLTSIIEVATLAMFHPWQQLAFGCTVALQLIRDDDAWSILAPLEQLAEELLRSFFVPTTLHQDIEHIPILIDGPPQIMALTIDRQKHLIQMPLVARSRPSAPEPIGIVLPELQTPLADGFIGDADAAFEQHLLHIAVAQGEAIVEPDAVANNLAWKAMMFVALGAGGRGHVWLPIEVFGWF